MVDYLVAILAGMPGSVRPGAKWEGSETAVRARLQGVLSSRVRQLLARCPAAAPYMGCKTDAMAGEQFVQPEGWFAWVSANNAAERCVV